MKAVQSFHVYSRAYVQVENDVSEWFLVNEGLRKVCVKSERLLYIWMYIYIHMYI